MLLGLLFPLRLSARLGLVYSCKDAKHEEEAKAKNEWGTIEQDT